MFRSYLIFSLSVFFPLGFLNAQSSPEPYSVRPDILSVEPRRATGLEEEWNKLLAAQVDFAAQILGLYSEGEQIVFLARDAEYVYDLARIFEPENTQLILANVSRANMQDPVLADYLIQLGVDLPSFAPDQKVVFVDTGFAGTIPGYIKSAFKNEYDSQILTHLIASDHPDYPSSRVFLIYLNARLALSSPRSLHGSIVSYEHLPRFTYRADTFVRNEDGSIDAVSKEFDEDGKVSRSEAKLMMADLRVYASQPHVLARFQSLQKLWARLRSELSDPDKLEVTLKALIENPGAVTGLPLSMTEVEAIIRDLYEVNARSLRMGKLNPITSLGIKNNDPEEDFAQGKSQKEFLISQYPEFKDFFQDPSTFTKKLLVAKEWIKISEIMELPLDEEMIEILVEGLLSSSSALKASALLESKIKDERWRRSILKHSNTPESLRNKILDALEKEIEAEEIVLEGPVSRTDPSFYYHNSSDYRLSAGF